MKVATGEDRPDLAIPRDSSLSGSQKDYWSLTMFLLAICSITIQGTWLGSWLVDDSAISMAYARNLVHHGQLVAQVGALPVEAYSNPLWVFLLAYVQGLGTTVAVFKGLAFLLLGWTAWRLSTAFPSHSKERLICATSAAFIAIQPSVVIWGFSGLENPLYLVAGVELFIRLSRVFNFTIQSSDPLWAGVAAASLSLTRPEGILYFPLYCIGYLYRGRTQVSLRKILFHTVLIPLFLIGAYFSFRCWYFEDYFPNTYRAKGGPTLGNLLALITLDHEAYAPLSRVIEAIFGYHFPIVGALIFCTVVLIGWIRKRSGICVAAGLLLLVALFAFLILPQDWMPELRFGTLVFPAAYLLGVGSLYTLIKPKYFRVVTSILLAGTAYMAIERIKEFYDSPPISIDEVKVRSENIAHWGRLLGITHPSLLTADIGGALLRDELVIVDLGMLADKTIAKSLGEGSPVKDLARFHDYVLNERKPDFMELRAYHSWIAHLDDDPRFRRDYVAIREYHDGWIRQRFGKESFSGDYVRRELVEGKEPALVQMRTEALLLPYPFCSQL